MWPSGQAARSTLASHYFKAFSKSLQTFRLHLMINHSDAPTQRFGVAEYVLDRFTPIDGPTVGALNADSPKRTF